MPILPFQKNKHLGVHHFEFNYFQRPNNKTTHSRQTEINVARLGWVMSCSASVSHKYSLNRNQVSFTAVRLICQSHKCTTGAGALSCLWNHFRKADFFSSSSKCCQRPQTCFVVVDPFVNFASSLIAPPPSVSNQSAPFLSMRLPSVSFELLSSFSPFVIHKKEKKKTDLLPWETLNSSIMNSFWPQNAIRMVKQTWLWSNGPPNNQ